MPEIRVKDEKGTIHVFPDGTTPEMIAQAMGVKPPSAQPTSVMKAPPTLFSPGWFKEKFYNGADVATNAMPAAGGIGGGILGLGAGGPVGGVGGAALGGAAGESARQLSRRALGFEDAPQTSLDAAKDIGIEAAKQGAYEAGGQGLRAAGRFMAPRLAEAAVAPGKRLLKSIPENVNIGRTVLDESSGYSPGSIAKQLQSKIADKSTQLDNVLKVADDNGAKVSLYQPRKLVKSELDTAISKNSPDYIKDVDKVRDQLQYQYGANGKPSTIPAPVTTRPGAGFVPTNDVPVSGGEPIPVRLPGIVPPTRARQIKQGIDLTINSFNPEAQSAIAPLQERVRGSLASQIHKSVPESETLDKALTSLIPAKDAAWNTSFNPGVTRNLFERFARPTGALIGTIAGAEEGKRVGGPAGAAIGGTAGLLAPLLLGSPTGMMTAARFLDNKLPAQLLRYGAPLIDGQRKDLFFLKGKPTP